MSQASGTKGSPKHEAHDGGQSAPPLDQEAQEQEDHNEEEPNSEANSSASPTPPRTPEDRRRQPHPSQADSTAAPAAAGPWAMSHRSGDGNTSPRHAEVEGWIRRGEGKGERTVLTVGTFCEGPKHTFAIGAKKTISKHADQEFRLVCVSDIQRDAR
eukprot:Hpha_TRINITY_DN12785_c0_g2::TRINITY_DN12785_c0_g2_i1::g.114393::m.114393